MPKMGEIIKRLRLEHGMTQEELGKHIGVQKSAIRKYESGMVENIPRSSIEKMAELFGVRPSYLMGWESSRDMHINFDLQMFAEDPATTNNKLDFKSLPQNVSPIKSKKLPMLGNVACGEPTFADEQHDIFVSASSDLDADFCLTANGDSMINARIFDGDVLFVKSQDMVDDGEIAVILIEDEATVKRVYYDRENNVITLVPENPMYKPMRYSGAQLDQIRILGKVVSGQYRII